MREKDTKALRVAFLDIESSHLKANFAILLCVSWKWKGEKKMYTVRFRRNHDPINERALLQKVYDGLKDANVIVTHYGSRFDFPMLQTKFVKNGISVLPPAIAQIDTWRIARYKMNLHSNRLDTLAKYLSCKYQKTALDPDYWIKAMMGDVKALDYIVEHCEYDVRVLEEVYEKIKILMPHHPHMGVLRGKLGTCPTCGSERISKHGYLVSQSGSRLKQRWKCSACGAWSSSIISENGVKLT